MHKLEFTKEQGYAYTLHNTSSMHYSQCTQHFETKVVVVSLELQIGFFLKYSPYNNKYFVLLPRPQRYLRYIPTYICIKEVFTIQLRSHNCLEGALAYTKSSMKKGSCIVGYILYRLHYFIKIKMELLVLLEILQNRAGSSLLFRLRATSGQNVTKLSLIRASKIAL